MNREIKFRGLRKDGKGWVYGCLINNAFFNSKTKHSIPYIFNPEECDDDDGWEYFDDDYGYYEVIPETAGQYTGLKNKRRREIYEGDIVMYSDKSTPLVVGFENGSFVLKKEGKTYVYNINPKELEVIGNIHENNN